MKKDVLGVEPATDELTITLSNLAFTGKFVNQGIWILPRSLLYPPSYSRTWKVSAMVKANSFGNVACITNVVYIFLVCQEDREKFFSDAVGVGRGSEG